MELTERDQLLCLASPPLFRLKIHYDSLRACLLAFTGLKICFSWPSDKMSDDFEFESDICMMMSDDQQFNLARK